MGERSRKIKYRLFRLDCLLTTDYTDFTEKKGLELRVEGRVIFAVIVGEIRDQTNLM